MSKKIAYY